MGFEMEEKKQKEDFLNEEDDDYEDDDYEEDEGSLDEEDTDPEALPGINSKIKSE
jgi:hypothetical protein